MKDSLTFLSNIAQNLVEEHYERDFDIISTLWGLKTWL